MPKPDAQFKGVFLDIAEAPQVTNRCYEPMGIDSWTRLPKREGLEGLGLKDVADTLEGLDSQEKPAVSD